MQTEKELNKALSEIYSDLEKLQSAREQVEIVTENSKELASATSILLKELREFSNQFGKENSSNIFQLTKSLNDFEGKINKISEKGNQSISEYIESFKKQIVGVIEQFSKQLADNEKNLKAISDFNFDRIGQVIDNFNLMTLSLKTSTESEIREIKSIALNKIDKQEKNISKTINSIEKTNSKANELIEIITNYDIPNSLEIINQKLDAQEKINKLNKVLLIATLSVLGITGIIAIVLLMKFL